MSTAPASPLATPEPWDLVSEAYAADVVPIFEQYASDALTQLAVGPGTKVLDVATGPGTLAMLAARLGARVDALDFAPEMVARLSARLEQEGRSGVTPVVGDGMALPYADRSFDAVFAMFGVMFYRDRARGLAELGRVVVPGGRVLIATWVPMDRVPFLHTAMQALADLTKGPAPAPALADPADCIAELSAAGLSDVTVREVTHGFDYPSTREAWAGFRRTCAPLALMSDKLGAAFEPMAARILDRLVERFGEGAHRVDMTALFTSGVR